jgi:hypothetical protein
MRTTIIHLEQYDDLVSTCDKMDWCKTGRILLVWPAGPFMLNRRLDLALLLRHSQKLGAQLALVCLDLDTRNKAGELGIPVFQVETEAQRKPWRRTRLKGRFSLIRESGQVFLHLKQKTQEKSSTAWKNRRVRTAVFGIGLIAFAALVLLFVPGARISLPMEKSEQSLDFGVWASPRTVVYNPSGGIPAHQRTVIMEGTQETPSSGTIWMANGYAYGLVQFINLTTLDVKVPVGTVLVAFYATPIRFVVQTEVIVPFGVGKTATTTVKAQKAGPESNIRAGEIRAFEGSLGLRLVVSNPIAMQGGSNQLTEAPSASDYDTLKENMLVKLQDLALKDLISNAQPGENFLPVTVKISRELEERQNPPFGTPAQTAQLYLRVEYTAWYYQAKDLETVAQIALDTTLESGKRVIPGTLRIIESQAALLEKEIVRWKVNATRTVAQMYPETLIVSFAAGQTLPDAQKSLRNELRLAENPQIEVSPPWWPWLPLLPFRIEVIQQ